ncbi:acyltransferase family protein [Modestobacter altitudinis]|uniref:acyltransferase family protein n=1 Tax=Modestobacter altitudinis TaxID=2213158 RepID=UPI002482FA6F|nr:acyltransferase [Modestobacter altitudinis]
MAPRPARPYHEHVHRLRGIAILGVVSTHVVSVLGERLTGPVATVFYVLFGEGSPIFLMISGFLFRETLVRYRYPRFIKRKAKNVLVPYLVISIPALVVYIGGFKQSHPWLSDSFLHENPVLQLIVFLVTGAHLGPLWFVPMILLFFIVSPVFAMVDRRPWLYLSIIPLTALTVLVPRPHLNSDPLQSFVHFCSLFVIGMCLARYHDRLINSFARHRAIYLTVGLVAVALLAALASGSHAFDSLSRGAFGLYLVFVLHTWRGIGPAGLVLDKLGEASFPIFFLHGYPVAGFRALSLDGQLGAPAWLALWGVVMVTTTLVTAAFAFGMRALLGARSRYVIGM